MYTYVLVFSHVCTYMFIYERFNIKYTSTYYGMHYLSAWVFNPGHGVPPPCANVHAVLAVFVHRHKCARFSVGHWQHRGHATLQGSYGARIYSPNLCMCARLGRCAGGGAGACDRGKRCAHCHSGLEVSSTTSPRTADGLGVSFT